MKLFSLACLLSVQLRHKGPCLYTGTQTHSQQKLSKTKFPASRIWEYKYHKVIHLLFYCFVLFPRFKYF
uniref:Uncharacterized protein n=1 Tax=Anguilla anguilla TaxID=7936 RepID=A0A0E9X0A8_ANGAN